LDFYYFPGKFHQDNVVIMKQYLREKQIAKRLLPNEVTKFKDILSSENSLCILDQLYEIGQLDVLLQHPSFSFRALEMLLNDLMPVQEFYKELGGIVGYQRKILSLLRSPDVPKHEIESSYHAPSFIDISKLDASTEAAVSWGIESLPEMAEMIPLGGAADRLHLVDEETGSDLPAAKLRFAGKILLERLICDIQAREYLYFQRFGKQVITPIVMMTSFEKDNHFHVMKILEENHWFGRPKESFRIMAQPLVPVVKENGEWLFDEKMKLVMKPGGHGAIWKLALDCGIFDWFSSLGRKKALIRQINNPAAAFDYGLLAFLGIGWKQNKIFGFASCPRLLRAAEGVNVLIEKEKEGKRSIVLTNIEYCDFAKFGIEDLALKEGEPYSRFSSNTNLLFVDLLAIRDAVEKSPFPGLLLNLKKGFFLNSQGEKQEAILGRLESTMQNIADVFVEEKRDSLVPEKTFITYNQRHKTISTTKKAFVEGGSLQETPESCFYDFLFAARELLSSHCRIFLPPQRTLTEYLSLGPEFIFLYHPCLGPLYSVIEKKLQGGSLSLGSMLRLEISDVLIEQIDLRGSLFIMAEQMMGGKNGESELVYSDKIGRCILKNVIIRNLGVDIEKSRPFWKGSFHCIEGVEIVLKGASEFIAEGVTFEGSHRFQVEDGMSMRVWQNSGGLSIETVKI
jgi:UTP---glucose-1-phosphate uridylyltransferase